MPKVLCVHNDSRRILIGKARILVMILASGSATHEMCPSDQFDGYLRQATLSQRDVCVHEPSIVEQSHDGVQANKAEAPICCALVMSLRLVKERFQTDCQAQRKYKPKVSTVYPYSIRRLIKKYHVIVTLKIVVKISGVEHIRAFLTSSSKPRIEFRRLIEHSKMRSTERKFSKPVLLWNTEK
ncbi:hypothetical protein CLF_102192 [Clonorchis sinensis]|uniref:Uncharacterized protein n=1 Tax=Clonorchis sinensis TaxID=79923 RepID=G7Y7G7_CLOSI|nr:hypothetical protein CLF_102192 [Clonorchis sinensis]